MKFEFLTDPTKTALSFESFREGKTVLIIWPFINVMSFILSQDIMVASFPNSEKEIPFLSIPQTVPVNWIWYNSVILTLRFKNSFILLGLYLFILWVHYLFFLLVSFIHFSKVFSIFYFFILFVIGHESDP